MKKLSLFFITCLLSASFAWADVSVTETYQTMPNISSSETKSLSKEMETSSGLSSQGTLAVWQYRRVRAKKTDTIAKNTRAFLFDRSCDINRNPYLQCTTWEGGIKNVHFNWKQVSADDDGQLLKIQVMLKDNAKAVPDITENINVEASETYRESTQSFTSTGLDLKVNSGQLIIYNLSRTHDDDAYAAGRILVGPITVTPYLLYRNKEVTIGSKQKGYVNQDLIDNTESGSITYSSDALGVATVDPSTGVVTPVAAGDAVITATWSEGVATTYTLHVVDGIIVENFSKVLTERPEAAGQETSAVTWQGDLFEWTVRNMRRGTDDTIGLSPRKQATAMRLASSNTYLQTNSEIEGGVKHIQFNYRQWASASGTLTLGINYGLTGGTWDTPAITHAETAATASTAFEFDEDIDDGTKGNNYMRLKYSVSDGGSGHIVIENIKITPYLLYTTKKASIGLNQTGFVNNDLIDNTGADVTYESSNTSVAEVGENSGVITPHAAGETTITASWGNVSTTYTLYVNGEATEDFFYASTGDISTSRTSYNSRFATWYYRNGRSKTSDKLAESNTRAFLLSRGASTYLESTLEGGVKKISFKWRQFDKGQNDYLFKMNLKVNNAIVDGIADFTGADGYVDADQPYSHDLNIKRDGAKLTIENLSTQSDGSTNGGDLIVGPISITPYLLYANKFKKFIHIGGTCTNTSLINNTGSETGTLSYRSSNASIASVTDEGVVTGVAEGTATIYAKFAWSGSDNYVETSYQVEVVPNNCETFSVITTNNFYTTNTDVQEDVAQWSSQLGGFNTLDDFDQYSAFIRAPRTNESIDAYIQSSTISGGIGSMSFDWNLVTGESRINWDIRVLINGREVKRLTNTEITSSLKMPSFVRVTIDDINEPDNFVIRIENRSTTTNTYTSGNRARFVIDNITWTSYNETKTLDENEDNSGWIRNNGGYTRTVAISRSPLQGGKWNTLCLPFAISKSTDLDGAEVQRMTSATLNPAGDELEIGFTEHTDDALTAGTPYLVKPSSNVDISKTYTNKPISMIASPVVQGIVTLQGIFSPTELVANDQSTLFVGNPDGEGNNLFYPEVTGNLLGFRAYFKIGSSASPAPALRRARFVVNAHTTPTDAEEITNHKSQITNKVIIDGQLIIIRDGKKYNVTGQKIQ